MTIKHILSLLLISGNTYKMLPTFFIKSFKFKTAVEGSIFFLFMTEPWKSQFYSYWENKYCAYLVMWNSISDKLYFEQLDKQQWHSFLWLILFPIIINNLQVADSRTERSTMFLRDTYTEDSHWRFSNWKHLSTYSDLSRVLNYY